MTPDRRAGPDPQREVGQGAQRFGGIAEASGAGQNLASSLNIAAFNLGNALSAWLGGLVIAAGFGYTAPNWAGAVLAASALVLALLSGVLERRTTSRSLVVARQVPTQPVATVRGANRRFQSPGRRASR